MMWIWILITVVVAFGMFAWGAICGTMSARSVMEDIAKQKGKIMIEIKTCGECRYSGELCDHPDSSDMMDESEYEERRAIKLHKEPPTWCPLRTGSFY